MKLNKTVILLLSILFSNCYRIENKKEEVKDDIIKEVKNISETNDYKNILNLPSDLRTFIFFDTVKVYALPDTLSKVVRTLKFSDSQYSISEHILHKKEYWYKLKGWNPDFKSGGYIKAEVMSDFYTSQSKYNLGFLGKKISNADDAKSFFLKLFDTSNNQVIQKYFIPNFYSYYNIDILYEAEHSLKGVDYIFHYKTDEDQCPGRMYEEIIVSKRNKLIKLWSSESIEISEDEDIEDENYTIYIPISTTNKIILAPWGDFKSLLKPDLTLDTIDYSSIEFSPNELIVFKLIRTHIDGSKNGYLKYYKWNGNSLEFIKKEKIK